MDTIGDNSFVPRCCIGSKVVSPLSGDGFSDRVAGHKAIIRFWPSSPRSIYPPVEVWRSYRGRADFGFIAFNMRDFFAPEAALGSLWHKDAFTLNPPTTTRIVCRTMGKRHRAIFLPGDGKCLMDNLGSLRQRR
jgi:hypothetical protein